MAPWTHVALKVSGLVGVLLMVYVVLVPRGTLERLAAEGGGGVVSTDTTQVTLYQLSALANYSADDATIEYGTSC